MVSSLFSQAAAVRDYIHVLDLVAAHVLGLEYLLSHKGIHTFNLGTGHGASVLEVIRATESALGKKIRYDIHPRRAENQSSAAWSATWPNSFSLK